jgi:hypothetical protein
MKSLFSEWNKRRRQAKIGALDVGGEFIGEFLCGVLQSNLGRIMMCFGTLFEMSLIALEM